MRARERNRSQRAVALNDYFSIATYPPPHAQLWLLQFFQALGHSGSSYKTKWSSMGRDGMGLEIPATQETEAEA